MGCLIKLLSLFMPILFTRFIQNLEYCWSIWTTNNVLFLNIILKFITIQWNK